MDGVIDAIDQFAYHQAHLINVLELKYLGTPPVGSDGRGPHRTATAVLGLGFLESAVRAELSARTAAETTPRTGP